jgi:hypothetical protein
MAKIRGMYLRGNSWWFRYTPAPGQPQIRVPLKTPFEQVAAAKAMEIAHKPVLEKGEQDRDE